MGHADVSAGRIAENRRRYIQGLEPDDLVSVRDAADLCGVSASAIRVWIHSKRLPAIKCANGTRLVRVLDLAKAKQASSRPAVIYYVQFAERIKIGTTIDLIRRLDDVPHDRVLALEQGGADLEKRRHAEFAEYHIIREWFRPGPRLLHHIAEVSAAGLQDPRHCA